MAACAILMDVLCRIEVLLAGERIDQRLDSTEQALICMILYRLVSVFPRPLRRGSSMPPQTWTVRSKTKKTTTENARGLFVDITLIIGSRPIIICAAPSVQRHANKTIDLVT